MSDNLFPLEKIKTIPHHPGIYKMLDGNKKIIYIGKAKNLNKRVSSYFIKGKQREITRLLINKIRDLDYIITANEKEALILENNLIKKFQPFFNIDLKDNKTYPYLWLTTHEKFPQLIKTRIKGKKGIYFGPYPNVVLADQYLKVLNLMFPLKKCAQRKFPKGFKPCLYFDMNQCLDYCTGNVAGSVIVNLNNEIKLLLNNKANLIVKKIKNAIKEASQNLHYEKAKILSESLKIIMTYEKPQSVEWLNENNFDVIDFNCLEKILVITILKFRDGKLLNKENYQVKGKLKFDKPELSTNLKEALLQYLFEFYKNNYEKINKIFLSDNFSQFDFFQEIEEVIQHAFSLAFPSLGGDGKERKKVTIKIPQQGKKINLIELAKANSNYFLINEKLKLKREKILFELKELLNLPQVPNRIECFDIANTANQAIMGGMVSYVNGKKDKSNYRLFHIRETTIQNDFKSMEEVVLRRYQRQLAEKKELPDLIIVDGGKGQLGVVQKSLEKLELKKIPLIALAKKKEIIFVTHLRVGLELPHSHPVLRFIVSIRDEAHRFINLQHERKRSKENFQSQLLGIKNLGEVKVKKLREQFDSWEAVLEHSSAEIKRKTNLSEKDIIRLFRYLKTKI